MLVYVWISSTTHSSAIKVMFWMATSELDASLSPVGLTVVGNTSLRWMTFEGLPLIPNSSWMWNSRIEMSER